MNRQQIMARLPALMRFAAGGVLSSGVTFGVTALLHEAREVPASIAAAIGFVCAVVVNFIVLRYIVFKGSSRSLSSQLVMFAGSTGVFRFLEYSGFLVLNVWLHWNYMLSLITVLGCSFLLKFAVYEGWLFNRDGKSQRRPTEGPVDGE